ncbi:hypothetical protein ONZ45_g5466 [Pleurotus djamor]|nr:hypothetical protein ONZ45_g5466 [Pleurotus djamor]
MFAGTQTWMTLWFNVFPVGSVISRLCIKHLQHLSLHQLGALQCSAAYCHSRRIEIARLGASLQFDGAS